MKKVQHGNSKKRKEKKRKKKRIQYEHDSHEKSATRKKVNHEWNIKNVKKM